LFPPFSSVLRVCSHSDQRPIAKKQASELADFSNCMVAQIPTTPMNTLEFEEAGTDYECYPFRKDYRFRAGSRVLYVTVELNCAFLDNPYDFGTPLEILSLLPPTIPDDHDVASIHRDGSIQTFRERLEGVGRIWHPGMVDVTTLPVVRQKPLGTLAYKVKYGDQFAVAKFAKHENGLGDIDYETYTYEDLEGTGIAPRFLAHLTEMGRVVGLLLEWIPSRRPTIWDLQVCQDAIRRFHAVCGYLHSEIDHRNFLVCENGDVKLISFEDNVMTDEKGLEEALQKVRETLQELPSYSNAPTDDEDYPEGEYPIGL